MFRQPLRNAKQRLRLFLSECGRRARVLRDNLRRQPNRIDPSSRFVPGFRYGYWEREARGLELLKEWLSPEQFAQYDAILRSPATTAESDTGLTTALR